MKKKTVIPYKNPEKSDKERKEQIEQERERLRIEELETEREQYKDFA